MRTTPLWLLLPVLVCCRGAVGDDSGDDDDDDTTDTGTWQGFQPEFFGVTAARFAVDDAGRASGFQANNGGTIEAEPMSMVITIGDATVADDGFTNDNSCTVTLVADGPESDAIWAENVGAWAAFQMPASSAAFTTCGALDFPPIWGDPTDVVKSWTWGFGVDSLHASVETSLRDSMGDDYADIEPYIVGGGAYWEGLVGATSAALLPWDDGWVDTAVVFAYEVDETLVEQRTGGGDPIFIDGADIHVGASVTRGLYDLQGTTVLTPAAILLP